jgi:hypothetical protein
MTEMERQSNQPAEEKKLNTADMAAAGHRSPSERTAQTTIEQDGEPIAAPLDVPKMDNGAKQTDARPTPLLSGNETPAFRSRWDAIQTGFVDEPRQAVEQADSLVAEVMKRLAETFADERAKLEEQWTRGENVSTEDLRVALQRYRSFFDRLLSM